MHFKELHMFKAIGICVFGLMASASMGAQTTAATPPQRPACSAAEFRQLDFWVGEWRVFQAADNAEVATSHIEHVFGDCAIKEWFESPGAPGGAYTGTSYSSWDRKDRKWHQMYVDNGGSVGLYVGGPNGQDMEFVAPGRAGSLNKMVYRPQADGSVRQIGTNSTDGGKTWTPQYDYIYRRK